MKKTIATIAIAIALCFAQDAPEKLAVYTHGSDAGVNKSFSGKLLKAMSQGGRYAETADPEALQDELARGGSVGLAQAAQAAKRHGADYVCVVSMTEAFGTYSVAARLVRTADAQVAKTGYAERPLKSMDDLAAVSGELARQLLPPGSYVPSLPASAAAPPPVETAAAAQKQCAKPYNINEILFKVKDGFPAKLKDCSSTLAKDMLNPFGKKLEPKSFMIQCPVDGIKKELPDGFPGTDKIVGSLTNFVQGLLNSAMAGGSLDPKKLISSIGSMDIQALLSDVKKLASGECVVDEPYEPPAKAPSKAGDDGDGKDGESSVSFGIRAGVNFSHVYADSYFRSGVYGDILGMQAGFVVDFAPSSWFHIQPGLMYIQKGMEDSDGDGITAHYIELPLLLSFKLSALRLNAGPYLGLCLDGDGVFDTGFDIGLSTGVGFDIGMFYIGAFYDYGFANMSNKFYNFYNRTLGLNVGINL